MSEKSENITARDVTQPTREELGSAVDDMRDSVVAFTYDGDRSSQDHLSGAPEERDLVLGEDDPRDAALAEHPLTEDVAWTGRIFNVDRLRVELPDGRAAIRDVVRHPGAVAVVALTEDGRICLVRQYRTALGRVTVEIPAGKLAPGEDPLECASRELLEETGMSAQKIAFLTTIASSAGFCDELIHIYMATGLAFGKSDPDADEFINVDLVPLDELIDAVLDGRIEDAKTVVGALVCDAIMHRLTPGEDAEE
ncbi:NUDIX hydrolase [Olsenella profusa]|uniref:NUDIX hydrolase n=2 Tax=Olsenella profusa TaxID=138595 RepID=A0ABS2F0K4_9ACTN|nr:NUDIX hydrolase [Olsenella profusa]